MENVVVEFVLLVPQTDAFAAEFVHRRSNHEKMFEELGRDIFVNVIFSRELDRNSHQVQREHSHPTSAVALLEMCAIGKLRVAIEDADVVESEKTALENIFAFEVFAIHPPGEGDQHFVEDRFQKRAVTFSGFFALDLINAPRRPRQHRRINVVEIPFVSRNFPVGMLIPFADDEIELRFGELNIDQSERNAVESKVPGCVPRKFPFVRHRHDALVVKMTPAGIAGVLAFVRRRRLVRIAIEPLIDDVVIELFAPKQSRERLPLHSALLFT